MDFIDIKSSVKLPDRDNKESKLVSDKGQVKEVGEWVYYQS